MEQDLNIYLISGMFILAGILHFVFPKAYVKIMPSYIPYPKAMVFWSGLFEVIGGVGFFVPFFRSFSAIGLILLLIAVFPANIDMFLKAFKKKGFTLYTFFALVRLPIQFWLMYWIFTSSELLKG